MEQGYVKIKIDGMELMAKQGQSVVEAAREYGIDIPTLCDFKSLAPAGTCRVCSVKIGGRITSGCTTPVSEGLEVESESEEMRDLRKGIIEMLFVEGNHMCPTCEKSGNCELQHLAYRYKMTAPRFPFLFSHRQLDARLPHLVLEHNRCIQCLRCVRGVKAKDGHDLFGFSERGRKIQITINTDDPDANTEETAQKAMDICPVGALIKKRVGFAIPIGERKYDHPETGMEP